MAPYDPYSSVWAKKQQSPHERLVAYLETDDKPSDRDRSKQPTYDDLPVKILEKIFSFVSIILLDETIHH